MCYHGAALLYAVSACAAGIVGLFQASWAIRLPATLLLAHGMIIAAYLVHECGHNSIFRRNRHNVILGRIMTWFCGAAYGTFEDIR